MENASANVEEEFPGAIHSAVTAGLTAAYERANKQVRAALRDFGIDPDRLEELLKDGPPDHPMIAAARRALQVRFVGTDPYLVEVGVEVERVLRSFSASKEGRVRKDILRQYNKRDYPVEIRGW